MEAKQQFEELQKNFHDVLELQKERTEAFDAHKKEVAGKIEAQVQAADDMISKMESLEKKSEELQSKNHELEVALARSIAPVTEEKAAEYEMNESVIRSYKEVAKDFTYDSEAMDTHKKSFDSWFKHGDKGLWNSGKTWSVEEQKFINTVIDPQGGFLVAPQYSTTVMPKEFEGRAIMDLVDRITIGSGAYVEPVDAADWADAAFSNELDAEPTDQNNEKFEQLTYYPHEIIYPKKISRVALEDQFVDVGYHIQRMQEGSIRTIAGKLLNGTSQDEPRGLLTYPTGTAVTGQVEQVNGTAGAGAISWDDLVKVLPTALGDKYQENLTYLMNKTTWRELLVSKDDEARYQMSEIMAMLKMNPGPSTDDMSVNIRLDAGMPSYNAGGNPLAVAYGNFKAAYLMVERIGFSVIRDETNAKFITYKLRRRVGGQLRIGEAMKLLKIQ